MSTITLKIPDTANMSAIEIEIFLAAKLYEGGKLSSGQAAEMIGLSKKTFIELLGKYGVSVFGYDIEEIENDLKNVRKID